MENLMTNVNKTRKLAEAIVADAQPGPSWQVRPPDRHKHAQSR